MQMASNRVGPRLGAKEPKGSIGSAEGNPYLDGRREWLERYGDYIQSRNAWRRVAIAALMVAFMGVGGALWLGSQNRFVPYVIQVDKLGAAVAVGQATEAQSVEPKMIRAQLARWIAATRGVVVDAAAQRQMIKDAYAGVNSRSSAYGELNDFFRGNQPFSRAAVEGVTVDIQSVLPISRDTWRVEWVETRRGRDGRLLSTSTWQSTITVAIQAPSDEAGILKNPLGIYVNAFSWQRRLSGETNQ